MGKLMITPGGGGTSSDEVTATKAQVLSGKTTITQDSNDEIAGGTMPDRGAWNSNVAMNGSVTVPQGHHSGEGKVNGPAITDRGAWGANIGINGRATIPQGYHSGGGSVGQSIPVQGADVAGTDRALATNISAWNGTMCSGVRNGHYLNGVNWIQANVPNLTAGNIKKGVNIAGLIGTWEGYIPDKTMIYEYQKNYDGFPISSSWGESGGSLWTNTDGSVILTNKEYNMSKYARLRIDCNVNSAYGTTVFSAYLYCKVTSSTGYYTVKIGGETVYHNAGGSFLSYAIEDATVFSKIRIVVNKGIQIRGIWLE